MLLALGQLAARNEGVLQIHEIAFQIQLRVEQCASSCVLSDQQLVKKEEINIFAALDIKLIDFKLDELLPEARVRLILLTALDRGERQVIQFIEVYIVGQQALLEI